MKNYRNMKVFSTNASGSIARCVKEGKENEPLVMKRVKGETTEFLDKCLKEVSKISEIKSENIVNYRDAFIHKTQEDDLLFCIVMKEYKMDLSKFIFQSNEPLKEEVLISLLLDISRGIEALHSKGITHRDIKPENVLIDFVRDKPRAYITDFGLSSFLDFEEKKMKSIVGTPRYTAPEILRGESYDKSVDIFSLGVTLYVMMTGDQESNIGNLFLEQKDDGLNFINEKVDNLEIVQGLKGLLRVLLSYYPYKRWTIQEIVSHLEKYNPEDPVMFYLDNLEDNSNIYRQKNVDSDPFIQRNDSGMMVKKRFPH